MVSALDDHMVWVQAQPWSTSLHVVFLGKTLLSLYLATFTLVYKWTNLMLKVTLWLAGK